MKFIFYIHVFKNIIFIKNKKLKNIIFNLYLIISEMEESELDLILTPD